MPSARPGTPSSTALTEISNSGAEVPKATTVGLPMSAGMAQPQAEVDGAFHQRVAGQQENDQPRGRQRRIPQITKYIPDGSRTGGMDRRAGCSGRIARQSRGLGQAAEAARPLPPIRGQRRRPNMASTDHEVRNRLTILSITSGRYRDHSALSSMPAVSSAVRLSPEALEQARFRAYPPGGGPCRHRALSGFGTTWREAIGKAEGPRRADPPRTGR